MTPMQNIQPGKKMAEQQRNFLLSTITEFDGMKDKRFTVKKCKDISPRIAALQKSLGFAPREPLNAKNFHRIIPAAEDIGLILNKRRKSMTPIQKIQPGKVSTQQNRFRPFSTPTSTKSSIKKVSTPHNRLSTSFRPGSSRMSSVTSRVHTPNTTNGVNSRFSTPTSAKSSMQKVSAHDTVGAILQRGSSAAVSSRFSTPNTAKSSIVKVTAPQNLDGRILEPGSAQTTNGTSHPPVTDISTGITSHNTKGCSFVKDKVHRPKNSDEDLTSSLESVSTVDTETYEENEIPDLVF